MSETSSQAVKKLSRFSREKNGERKKKRNKRRRRMCVCERERGEVEED